MNACQRTCHHTEKQYFSAHKPEIPQGRIATGTFLVILDKDKLLPEDYDTVTYPLTMLGWDLGKEINPIMYSAKE